MTQKPAKTVTQRGQSKPPSPELARYIKLVNGTEDVARIHSWLHDAPRTPPVNTLKPDLREFLGPTIDLRKFRENCLLLDTANEVLNHIADQRRLDGDGSGMLSLPVNLYTDDEGAIAASGKFLNAVIGAKADR